MKTRELLLSYAKGLLKEWYVVAIAVFDFIGLVVQPFLPVSIPIWVNLTVFALVFIYANYSLYREDQKHIREIDLLYERKILELQEKITEIEDRQPRLELLFQVDQGFAQHHVIEVLQGPDEPEIDELVRQEAEQLEPAPAESRVEDPHLPANFGEVIRQAVGFVRKSREEYAKECEDYLDRYRDYLIELYVYETYKARFRTLRFAVQNSGRAPAENIVVIMHFPDVFLFDSPNGQPFDPPRRQPEPPKRPSLTGAPFPVPSQLSALYDTPLSGWVPDMGSIGPSTVRGPFIKSQNSVQVTYEIDELLHNLVEVDLDSLTFMVSNEAIRQTWELTYTLHTANLPEPTRGSLWVEIRLVDRDESNMLVSA